MSVPARYDVLDAAPEQAFDDLTLLAARICRTPIAFVGLVAGDRLWFKSSVGLTVAETDRTAAFCESTLRNGELLVVPDTMADPRFTANSLVIDEPHVRFYAGAPLVTPDGRAIGTLSVIDLMPRELSDEQQDALRILARQVVTQLDLRRQVARGFTRTETRHHGAEALAEVGRLLSETLDPDVVGQRIADTVRSLLAVESAALYRLEAETGDLVMVASSRALRCAFEWSAVVCAGTGTVSAAVRERAPVVSSAVLRDPRISFPPDVRARLQKVKDRAILAVPLSVKGRIIGALAAADPAGRAFGEPDVRLTQAFADQAALALENARLYAEAELGQREAEIVAELTQAINSTLDLDTILQRVTERAREVCQSADRELRARPPDRGRLRRRGAGGGDGHRHGGAHPLREPRGRGALRAQPLAPPVHRPRRVDPAAPGRAGGHRDPQRRPVRPRAARPRHRRGLGAALPEPLRRRARGALPDDAGRPHHGRQPDARRDARLPRPRRAPRRERLGPVRRLGGPPDDQGAARARRARARRHRSCAPVRRARHLGGGQHPGRARRGRRPLLRGQRDGGHRA
ncbi:MAG: GAF domain-containing protein [Candidatus Rokubacteria bacterium]|nr:GAF domain-containing protein [Candidatus Rokubacteria bacterium]